MFHMKISIEMKTIEKILKKKMNITHNSVHYFNIYCFSWIKDRLHCSLELN